MWFYHNSLKSLGFGRVAPPPPAPLFLSYYELRALCRKRFSVMSRVSLGGKSRRVAEAGESCKGALGGGGGSRGGFPLLISWRKNGNL